MSKVQIQDAKRCGGRIYRVNLKAATRMEKHRDTGDEYRKKKPYWETIFGVGDIV